MSRLGLSATIMLSLAACSQRAVDLDRNSPAASVPAANGALPVVLAAERAGIWVDAQRLYWVSGSSSIQSCRKADCAHTLLDYTSKVREKREKLFPVVAGQYVYWASRDSIYSCAAEVPEPEVVTQDPALRLPPFANGDYVYWSSDYDLYRCRASGCKGAPEVVATNASAQALAFDERYAYWIDRMRIMAAPADGSGQPAVLYQGPDDSQSFSAGNLVVGGGFVYWSDAQRVLRCPIAGCGSLPPTSVVTGDSPLEGITLDGHALYWIEADTLRSCALPDCAESFAITPLSVVSGNPSGEPRFAVDANDIYWLEPRAPELGGHTIRRTAKQ